MSGQQKRGFRLPWTAEQRGSEEASAAATMDQGTLDSAPAAVGDDLGDGPFHRAKTQPAMTKGAAPAASNVSDDSAEAEMIDTDSMQDRIERGSADGAWPTMDRAGESAQAAEPAHAATGPDAAPEVVAGPPAAVEGESRGRRENPLVAGLVKAMREAAIASRAETTTRLQAEAATRIEAIRAESTEEAAALRKRVDEDIAGIREWSKVEMARIRAETEHRIEERRADAINESQRHLDAVEELVGQVQSTVSAFDADTEQFFQRLLAETDPAQLAAIAEQAPEPPDLTGDLPKPTGWTARTTGKPTSSEMDDNAVATETSTEVTAEAASVESAADHTAAAEPAEAQADHEALQADAAAEAEAAATEGLDLSTAEEWPAAVMAAARRADDAASSSDEGGTSSKLLVSGLTSVAGISAFKGAIGGLPGVRSVSVSTGERGVFVYTVNHEPETDIAAAIGDLSAFAVRITGATGDSLSVTAHEPAA
jgi:hypothetical protein